MAKDLQLASLLFGSPFIGLGAAKLQYLSRKFKGGNAYTGRPSLGQVLQCLGAAESFVLPAYLKYLKENLQVNCESLLK